MIVRDRDGSDARAQGGALPAGLPAGTVVRQRSLTDGRVLVVLAAPVEDAAGDTVAALAEPLRTWASQGPAEPARPPVVVPLYGCLVAWGTGRVAVAGPFDRLGELEAAAAEFATREAELADAERRATDLVATLEPHAATAFEIDGLRGGRHADLSARYGEAVAIGGRLAVLAAAIHAPPIHPPTLASQLGERLRERSRLAERHELAVGRTELAERVLEACGQRAADAAIGRRQTSLEWTIVILLLVQTVLLVVDLLAQQGSS